MTGTVAYVLSKKYTDGKIAELPVPFKPSGTIGFENLPSVPTASDLGRIWNISNAFTTDSRFIEGPGKSVAAGNNVAVIDYNGSYYFDVFSQVDLSNYYTKTETGILLGEKQNRLTHGEGISLEDDDISVDFNVVASCLFVEEKTTRLDASEVDEIWEDN